MLQEEQEDGNSASAWSINESNLTVPAVDNIPQDVESYSNLNENSNINESSLGPTLLIGLDKNFFVHGEDGKDVIFVENGGIKFETSTIKIDGSGHKSFLASGNYLISFVEPGKTLSWESNNLRNIRKVRQDAGEPSEDLYDAPAICDAIDKLPSLQDIRQDEPEDEPSVFKPNEITVVEASEGSPESFHVDRAIFERKEVSESAGCNNASKNVDEAAGFNEGPVKSLKPKKKSKAKTKSVKETNSSSEVTPPSDANQSSPSTSTDLAAAVPVLAKGWKKRVAGKRRCCYSESEASGDEDVGSSITSVVDSATTSASAVDSATTSAVGSQSFENINDLIQDLKSKNVVDDAFSDLIIAGFAEMKADIVQELNKPQLGEKFSYELLAFAFLLYFKRRPAYSYLHNVYLTRWPTPQHLKDWKKLVNSKPVKRKKPSKKQAV